VPRLCFLAASLVWNLGLGMTWLVDDIVLVIEVEDVSVVDIVLDIPVSVAAVSVAFSSFLQPNANTAIATRARNVVKRDLFMKLFSFLLFTEGGM